MGPGFAAAPGMSPTPLARAALDRLRRLDHRLGRAWSRRRVLVDARTPMNLAVLAPVWQALLEDDRIDVRFTGPDRADLRAAHTEYGVEARVLPRARAARQRWDLYMNADPWDPAVLWRCRHRVNFFHGVAGKYNLECPAGLPLEFHRYDRVAFPNEGRLERYVAAGLVERERAVLVGFPKLDRLVNAAIRPREAARGLGLTGDRPVVIYAPTFSPHASLQRHGEAIVRELLAAGIDVIVKLHDRSLDPDPRYSGGVDWRARFAPLVTAGRCLLASSGDSTAYLLAAEAMVTDHSTIGFEFCALDRPLVVFDVPELLEEARVDPAKVVLLRRGAEVVRDPAAVPRAIHAALAAPERRAGGRAAAVRAVFHDPGRATARAVALCYDLLDCSPHPAGERLGAVAG